MPAQTSPSIFLGLGPSSEASPRQIGRPAGNANYLTSTSAALKQEVNDRPTALVLSQNRVFENQPVGALVGLFTTTDPNNPDDSFTYTLVNTAAAACKDDIFFGTYLNRLVTKVLFNYELRSSRTS